MSNRKLTLEDFFGFSGPKSSPVKPNKHWLAGAGASNNAPAAPIKKTKAAGDPTKQTGHGEFHATDHGSYCVISTKESGSTEYIMHYVSKSNKFEDLGRHGSRQSAIQAMLSHHDKKAGGIK